MSSDNLLEKVKQLREITGVGFKDCKNAIDETKGDIEKSIELLRKKGIAKASKRMARVAAEGLICIYEQDNKFSMIEINSETDFVAKNNQFLNFAEEISKLALIKSGKIEDILNSTMINKKNVKDNLVDLISKIGEKITIRKCNFFDDNNKCMNFSYIHTVLKKNIGKLGVLVRIESKKFNEQIKDFGHKLAMHIAASNPLALEANDINKDILDKEVSLISEELKNTGKPDDIIKKISIGKINKFKEENALLTQSWVMEPKKTVKDILKELSINDLKIKDFYRLKIGE